jgi:hypothetical protein
VVIAEDSFHRNENEVQRLDSEDDAPRVVMIGMYFEVAGAVDLVNSGVTLVTTSTGQWHGRDEK